MGSSERHPLAVKYGARLRRGRLRRSMSQAQAALRLGLTTSTYRAYELGDVLIPLNVVEDCPRVFGLPREFFFGIPERPEMTDEDRLLLLAFQATKDPELHKISLDTVERNWHLDQRARGAS